MKYKLSGNVTIHTPGVPDMSVVKKTIKDFDDRTEQTSVYPNGFELKTVKYLRESRVDVYFNMALVQNPDGTFTAPTDK